IVRDSGDARPSRIDENVVTVTLSRRVELLAAARIADLDMPRTRRLDLKAGRTRVSEIEGHGPVIRANRVDQEVSLLIIRVETSYDEVRARRVRSMHDRWPARRLRDRPDVVSIPVEHDRAGDRRCCRRPSPRRGTWCPSTRWFFRCRWLGRCRRRSPRRGTWRPSTR